MSNRIYSSDVQYSNTTSGLTASSVQSAIDEIAEKNKKVCPDGYKCSYECTEGNCPTYVRATSLHSEGTEVYGNLGTDGVLNSGDAFDCDVNGDGIYDSISERFYYVTDLHRYDAILNWQDGVITYDASLRIDSDVAVLIYYNNVVNGVSDSSHQPQTSYFSYNEAGTSIDGPVSLVEQLPTRRTWPKLDQIISYAERIVDSNTTFIQKSEWEYLERNNIYYGYVARLLTIHELLDACNISLNYGQYAQIPDSCNYLSENTYDIREYWLETPSPDGRVFVINGEMVDLRKADATNQGVRPVIEVNKSKISY